MFVARILNLLLAYVHYIKYIHYVVNSRNMVNSERQLVRDAEDAIQSVFDEMGGGTFRTTEREVGDARCDAILQVTSAKTRFEIGIEAKARITPQTALSVCERMQRLPADVMRVVFAPVISPRVAEILEQFGVGHVDRAGNCHLRSAQHRLLIDRRGRNAPSRLPKGTADPFSPKSSRIVRALLSEPGKGWRGHELAVHPDVTVSPGLVVKVKKTLVEESYALDRKRLLYLRDPVGLLETWAQRYHGPAEQVPMYFLGDAEAAEQAVASWCQANDLKYALAGFSAAWRLAPEVRYTVAAVYVDDRGFDREMIGKLSKHQGGKCVETGANLLLWRAFDRSVLAGIRCENTATLPVTSAIQTYLDLKKLAGRGEEAATAVYERLLVGPLRDAAERNKGMRHDEL